MQDGNDMEQDNNDGLILGEDEVYAWRELRLHPLLITAVRRLGFKEPTPIQKACFPAAAHQGKVRQVLTIGQAFIWENDELLFHYSPAYAPFVALVINLIAYFI
jgi:hypothetical protein